MSLSIPNHRQLIITLSINLFFFIYPDKLIHLLDFHRFKFEIYRLDISTLETIHKALSKNIVF